MARTRADEGRTRRPHPPSDAHAGRPHDEQRPPTPGVERPDRRREEWLRVNSEALRRWMERNPRRWTPWLVIRASAGDLGLRPLPQGEVFYYSPDIWVESSDPGGNAVAGEPNYVHARLFNLGMAPAAPTRVDFYWGDPSVGLGPANLHWIGTEWVEVDPLRSRDVRCGTPWVPIFLNGGHECLIVNCNNAILDPIKHPFYSWLDRHVGQRNLTVLKGSPGAMLEFIVTLNNPWRRTGRTLVTTRLERLALDAPIPEGRVTRELVDQLVGFGLPLRRSAAELRALYREGTPAARAAAIFAGLEERRERHSRAAGAAPGPSPRRHMGSPGSIGARLADAARIVPTPHADAHLGHMLLASEVLATRGRCAKEGGDALLPELVLKPFEQRQLHLELGIPPDARRGEFVVFHLAQRTEDLLLGGYAIVVEVV